MTLTVTMVQGAGGHVPENFKKYGYAHKVSAFHSRDGNFYAQATNYSIWEMEVEEQIDLPYRDYWRDSYEWNTEKGCTVDTGITRLEQPIVSETTVYLFADGKAFFVTGQCTTQEDVEKVRNGQAYLEWETFTRTDGTGRFVVQEA